MTVYVDNLFKPATVGAITSEWCHLTADSDQELHAFAKKIGMKRVWAQYSGTWKSHYDLTVNKRLLAVSLGAVEITIQEAGLRFREKQQLESEHAHEVEESFLW